MSNLTLNGKYSYEGSYSGVSVCEMVDKLISIDNCKKIVPATYSYDCFVTIVHVVCHIYLNNKDDMLKYYRGQLDGDIYLNNIHEELRLNYMCYKNMSDDDKKEKGRSLKRKTCISASRDDIFTTYVYNLDDELFNKYNIYIDTVLKKITESMLLNSISNMNI